MHNLRWLALAAASAALAGCGSSSSGGGGGAEIVSGTTFSDSSDQLVPFIRGFGEGYGGLAWFDYDRDGDLDLLLTNEKTTNSQVNSSALYSNNGDGTFTDVSVAANAAVFTGNSSAVVGDIDNDGWPDVFMSGTGFFAGDSQSQTVLLHNQGPDMTGQVTFVDIAASAGVPGAETALSAAFGDINNDGFVDLFVTGQGHLGFGGGPPAEQHEDRLYLNNGDLTFTDITAAAGVLGGEGSCVATFSHFNDDEFIDLFVGVCNDVFLAPTPWYVYVNNGDNTFTDVAPSTQLDQLGYWMSSTFGDIDNDGDFDIFSTNLGGNNTHRLWRNNGDGTYVDIASDEMKSQDNSYWAWGATFADFDNDGFQDLFYGGELPGGAPVGKGSTGYLFMNNGNSRFRLDQEAWTAALGGETLQDKGVTGIGKADFDNDGFVDIAIMTGPARIGSSIVLNPPILLRNEGNDNTWIAFRLEGDSTHPTAPSNRMAIGARIEVLSTDVPFQAREIWAGTSFVTSESQWPVFGLGQGTSAEAIVYWPSGLTESFPDLPAGERHHLIEGTGTAL